MTIDPQPAAARTAGPGLPSGYHEWPLPPVLHERIEAGWTFRAEARACYCVPPDGRIDLVLRARVDGAGRLSHLRAAIAGPGWQPSWVPADGHTLMAGLRCVPGWGGACLGVEPAALRGRVLLGEAAERIARRCAPGLLRLRTQAQLPQALADAARALAARAQPAGGEARAAAAAALLAAEPGLPVPVVAARLGTSERTLRRDVASTIGLPLQMLVRLQRLHRALHLQAAQPGVALASLAAEAGYSDQAHMTRDFQCLAAGTPARRPALPLIRIHGLR